MKNGLYKYQDTSFGNRGEVVLWLRETEKSYILELVRNTMRFSPAHIEMMFEKSYKIRINKAKSPHVINTVGDDWFCIYPYRAGIPYVFEYISKEGENNE